ncbi:MAG: sodium:solute symporter family protein [Lachnospiraceae bacterium]|nr:sodium:solute symporter family protein [Lachnospiraceae bacterium]
MNIFFIGVILSIVVYLIAGFWAGRNVKDVDDYYVAGRSAPTILIAGTLFASMLSVNGFMGDQGWVYTGNLVTLIGLDAICAIGYVAGPLMFGRYLRRSECNTMPEFFGNRFNSFKNRRVAGIVVTIGITTYLISSITGVGILMQELTGLSYNVCIFLAWFTFTAFTFYSGSSGVILTDTMMFLVFLVAAIISGPYIFNAQGGLGSLLENLMNNPNLPEGALAYHGNIPGTGAINERGAVIYMISTGIMWLIVYAISPWQAGRNMMAKSEHVIVRAGCVCAFCGIVFLLWLSMQSQAVINLKPDLEDSQRVLIWAAYNVMPKIVGTLMLSGIMAAGLSSASTFLSVVGFTITTDLVQHEFKNDKEQLRISRIVMLIAGVIALVLTYAGLGGIRIVTYFASSMIAASWGVSGIGSIWSKKLSATGARWSQVAGMLGYVIPRILKGTGEPWASLFGDFLDPFFIGLLISLLFAVLGSKLYPVTEPELAYRERLMILPDSEKVASEYKRDRIYGYILIIGGIATTLFLVFGWAIPYNALK